MVMPLVEAVGALVAGPLVEADGTPVTRPLVDVMGQLAAVPELDAVVEPVDKLLSNDSADPPPKP